MTNPFSAGERGFSAFADITPSDTVEQGIGGKRIEMILVTGAGDVVMTDYQDNDITLPALAGVQYDVSPKLIKSTGTSATGIIGFCR